MPGAIPPRSQSYCTANCAYRNNNVSFELRSIGHRALNVRTPSIVNGKHKKNLNENPTIKFTFVFASSVFHCSCCSDVSVCRCVYFTTRSAFKQIRVTHTHTRQQLTQWPRCNYYYQQRLHSLSHVGCWIRIFVFFESTSSSN